MPLRPPASCADVSPLRVLSALAAATAAPLLLLGCSSASDAPSTAAESVTISDQWAKAADSGMSAAFGELHNAGDREVTVVAANSPVSATVELHEVATDSSGTPFMRPKAGGFVIPARGELSLAPGGDHIMFIDLRGALRTGTDAPVTLTFSDGSTTTFTAQVRDFSGNQEDYRPDGGAQPPAHSD
ncbi:copper chaperone PCu(A)C [Nocardia testacea]|uniref:Copper chaperone PCu(A)C n=1 Tax=Nocardia testacea TaxID=248551 RepID=A0ABW7VX74_9NOCA